MFQIHPHPPASMVLPAQPVSTQQATPPEPISAAPNSPVRSWGPKVALAALAILLLVRWRDVARLATRAASHAASFLDRRLGLRRRARGVLARAIALLVLALLVGLVLWWVGLDPTAPLSIALSLLVASAALLVRRPVADSCWGLILRCSRTLRPGARVAIVPIDADRPLASGEVVSLGLRRLRLRTSDDRVVTVHHRHIARARIESLHALHPSSPCTLNDAWHRAALATA